MMGSKTRLKHFVYIVCLQEGSELLRNSLFNIFERNGRFDIGRLVFYIFWVKVWLFQERLVDVDVIPVLFITTLVG